MRRIARWLRWAADWLDRIPDPLLVRAKQLVAEADLSYPAGYGEAKRHHVYSRLLKEFPHRVHSRIGLAIELAVRDK